MSEITQGLVITSGFSAVGAGAISLLFSEKLGATALIPIGMAGAQLINADSAKTVALTAGMYVVPPIARKVVVNVSSTVTSTVILKALEVIFVTLPYGVVGYIGRSIVGEPAKDKRIKELEKQVEELEDAKKALKKTKRALKQELKEARKAEKSEAKTKPEKGKKPHEDSDEKGAEKLSQ
jgi:hypothetical protein